MYSRWFTAAIVVFWLTTMGWLVIRKVLPPLTKGEPPSYGAIVSSRGEERLAAWDLALEDGTHLGWALSEMQRRPEGGVDLLGFARFEHLPLARLTPQWVRRLFRAPEQPWTLKMEAESSMGIDPEGKISEVHSAVRVDPSGEMISLDGRAVGNQLSVTLRSSGFAYNTEVYLPPGALLDDALSPQSQLPGLHEGQSWTVPAYSPLRPPTQPVEILRAAVDGRELIHWNENIVECLVVTYRNDTGLSSSAGDRPRGRLWVTRDGMVLKQEVWLLDTSLVFTRMPEERAQHAQARRERLKALRERTPHD